MRIGCHCKSALSLKISFYEVDPSSRGHTCGLALLILTTLPRRTTSSAQLKSSRSRGYKLLLSAAQSVIISIFPSVQSGEEEESVMVAIAGRHFCSSNYGMSTWHRHSSCWYILVWSTGSMQVQYMSSRQIFRFETVVSVYERFDKLFSVIQ